MDTIWLIAIGAAVVIAIVALVVWMWRRDRGDERNLRKTFGSEYDRTVERRGDEEAAREELVERLERREEFEIRELDDDERNRFADEWIDVQRRFVDEPEHATEQADDLIQRVMKARGYPVEDFEQRARDLSVDHPEVVEHYRKGRRLLDRSERVPTEDYREAMLHLRELYERLVGRSVEPAERS
ncbi:MAG: hypothetical protein R3343_13480 [Nitriliruptorales bacterium]|nr:hypothetical protein [Nitriliruptorales bacterium]